MEIRNYTGGEKFLHDVQDILESSKAANNLMLGVCGQLLDDPEHFVSMPCIKTVWDEGGLIIAALMTPPFKLIIYGHQGDLDGGIDALVDEIYSEGWELPGVLGPGPAPKVFAQTWKDTTGQPYRLEMRQRVYRLDDVNVSPPMRGSMRLAVNADFDLVCRWFYQFYKEIGKKVTKEQALQLAENKIKDRDVFLWEDGEVVSLACKSRPTKRGISIIMVYTPPESRGKGYATVCVSELGEKLLAEGYEFITLFADLANDISNHVYRKIGFEFVIDYDEYTFLVK
jgi:predicted GNAT family acetyltransferase